MSAEERLRRYLEQRREMGESELVLDAMTVDDVMKVLGAARTRAAKEQDVVPTEGIPPLVGDWRAQLRASGAGPSQPPPRNRPAERQHPDRAATAQGMEASPAPGAAAHPTGEPASAPRPRPADAPAAARTVPGISIGGGGRQLFGGPFGALESLEAIAGTVAECTRCPLYKTATHPVPGEGNPNADLMIVGEAPGANEDATGRPFVGAAGQLLTRILEAISLKREDVFICNVLKHRPPDNRNPLPQEVEACSPYLVRQIELIRPKAILALGLFAAQTLLNSKLPLVKLRESVHQYYGIPLIVTYHPAALLRNPNWKRPTWEDVKLARRILDGSASADA